MGLDVLIRVENVITDDFRYYCLNQSDDTYIFLVTDYTNTRFYESRLYWVTNNSLTIVQPFGLTDCTSGEPFLNYSCRDEDTQALLTCNYSQTFTLVTEAGTTYETFSGEADEWEICFYPEDLDANVSSFEEHDSTGYSKRFWFLTNVGTDEGQNVTIYLLSEDDSKLTYVYVKENGIGVENATVYVQRYYPATNDYLSVAMLVTNDAGGDALELIPNEVYYRFLVIVDGALVHTSASQKVICEFSATSCSVILNIDPETVDYWTYYDDISGVCDYNETSNILSCTYADLHGTVSYARLIVTKIGVTQETTICDVNSTAVSDTLICDLAGNTTGLYNYYLMAKYNPEYSLDWGSIDLGAINPFSDTGLLLAFLMFITLAFIGVWNPPIGIILGLVGIGGAYAIGMIEISWGALAAVFVSGIILAVRMRT